MVSKTLHIYLYIQDEFKTNRTDAFSESDHELLSLWRYQQDAVWTLSRWMSLFGKVVIAVAFHVYSHFIFQKLQILSEILR